MRPFETLAECRTPEGRRLALHRRDGDYFILLDGEELMSTRRHHSETALAELALGELAGVKRPHVLIGGLGLGFTLRAGLRALPRGGTISVVELFGPVVEWSHKYLDASAEALADPRVVVIQRDVADVIEKSRKRFDAILLDVDNGPSAWCLEANARLYGSEGLDRVKRALRPGGVLGVWSAFADSGFVRLLEKAGFKARVETVRSRGEKGSKHRIFLARLS